MNARGLRSEGKASHKCAKVSQLERVEHPLSLGESLWAKPEDRLMVCSLWLERKLAVFDAIKRNKSGCHSIIKMVLRVMSLFANLECNVDVVPDEHKGLGLCDLPRLSQSFFAETLEFADGLCI